MSSSEDQLLEAAGLMPWQWPELPMPVTAHEPRPNYPPRYRWDGPLDFHVLNAMAAKLGTPEEEIAEPRVEAWIAEDWFARSGLSRRTAACLAWMESEFGRTTRRGVAA